MGKIPSRIILAGAAHIDRTGWLNAAAQPGCSNPGAFEETPGGTGLNIACLLSDLGHQPVLLTQIGRDVAGDFLLQRLRQRGVEIITSADVAAGTGSYTSVIEPDGSLHIAVADMTIYETFKASPLLVRVECLTNHDWLCVDTNLPPREVTQLLDATCARRVGLTVSKAKAPRMREWLDRVEVVFTNRIEACALCGLGDASEDGMLMAALRSLPPETIVMSNGEKPVQVISQDGEISLPAEIVKPVVDVTGAGDALVAASLSALARKQSLVAAINIGVRAAAATIQVRGSIHPDLAKVLNTPTTTYPTSC